MRAVLSVFSAAGVLASLVLATPLVREKRYAIGFAGSPFGTFASAGAGFPQFYPSGAAAGFGPQFYTTGAATGASADRQYYPSAADPFQMFGGFNPFRMFMPVPVVVPSFNFKQWYEGENVCTEKKVVNSQLPGDTIPAEWKEGLPSVSSDYNHEQESCQGTDKKYVCMKRVYNNNGESQMIATKYECCHGFVRPSNGAPGCVENKQNNTSGASEGSAKRLTEKDPSFYQYTGNAMQSRSSSSSAGNIDKVPLQ